LAWTKTEKHITLGQINKTEVIKQDIRINRNNSSNDNNLSNNNNNNSSCDNNKQRMAQQMAKTTVQFPYAKQR